jgi:hypothetical protein
MDILEVKGMYMVEEQDHLTNHRLGEEGMNMVEVKGMDTVEGHFYLMNHRPEVEGMDTVEEHFHPMNHRPKVEGINMVDTGLGEDRAAELEVVEREPEGMVLARHWTGEALPNSSEVGGAYETGVFKRSTHVCNSELQL